MRLMAILFALAYERLTSLIRRGQRGSRSAWREIVDALMPVVRARVSRELARAGGGGRLRSLMDTREDVEQQVFLVLFRDDAKTLRDYDPERGLSVENYVGMIARREAGNATRYWRAQSRKAEVCVEDDREVEGVTDGSPDAEIRAAGRQQLDQLWKRLEEHLTPKGLLMFRLLFIEGLSADEVSATVGCTKRSVYNWKNKLKGEAEIWQNPSWQ